MFRFSLFFGLHFRHLVSCDLKLALLPHVRKFVAAVNCTSVKIHLKTASDGTYQISYLLMSQRLYWKLIGKIVLKMQCLLDEQNCEWNLIKICRLSNRVQPLSLLFCLELFRKAFRQLYNTVSWFSTAKSWLIFKIWCPWALFTRRKQENRFF